MNELRSKKIRRMDIDGLRAIAVLAVIFFHLGFLKHGYLGVDVFFVISGFLIIGIISNEASTGTFSMVRFYIRRIRRIIPLVLISGIISLAIGLIVMLPDDLENLAQSVFATNVFANNILLLLTSKNYWETVNNYKPLMHTWSLGVEEQFYLLIPIMFVFLKKSAKFALPALVVLSSFSILLFVLAVDQASVFYLLHYRFFELGVGGIAAILTKGDLIKTRYSFVLYVALLVLLVVNFPVPDSLRLLVIVAVSVLLLSTEKNDAWIDRRVFQNQAIVWVGKISFSLYMWHQIMLAFGRYFVVEQFHRVETVAFLFLLFLFSTLSYYFIEQPFQNPRAIDTKRLFLVIGLLFSIATGGSLFLYAIAGVVRTVPELGIDRKGTLQNFGNSKRHAHIEYNAKIYDLDKPFDDTENKVKILVVGDSFARDFANILLESRYADRIALSYSSDPLHSADGAKRFSDADIICFSKESIVTIKAISEKYRFGMEKVWNVGTKNFGFNNGIFYNKSHDKDYYRQRSRMMPGTLERNAELKQQWGDRYIDLISLIVDEKGRVPVFTSDQKFFSQDCAHLTKAGADEFSHLIDLDSIFSLERRLRR